MLSVRSTSRHLSPSSSESSLDEIIDALQIRDDQDTASTPSSFLELVGALRESETPSLNFSDMLELHHKFAALDSTHLKNVEQLRKFPNDSSCEDVGALKRWNIKSINDVHALWDVVIRISTITVSARIHDALQLNRSPSSIEPTLVMVKNFRDNYAVLAGSSNKSEFSKRDIDTKIALLTLLLDEYKKLEQKPPHIPENVDVKEQLAGVIAKTIGPIDCEKVYQVAQNVLQIYNVVVKT